MGFSRQEYWSGVSLPSLKCSLGISNFLEEIASLSHSVVFLYFSALIAEEGFLFLQFFGTLHSDAYIFPFLLCFSLLFSSQLLGLLRQPFCLCAFLFLGDGLGPCLCTNSWTTVHGSSGTLSDLVS